MSRDVYATNKLAWHPDALEALRRGEPTAPRIIQLMPTAVCNQACAFCSYGSGPESVRAKIANPPKSAWKNQTQYDTRASLSREKMVESIACFQRMGVKCVEVTGGGEPTVYAHFDELVEEIDRAGLEFALVTNGTRITGERAARMGRLPFVWVRVSIDAGTPEEYVRTRNVPASHWDRAWEAVALFAAESRKPHAHPESTVGVGFVIDRDNWRGVYEACRLAKHHGAHNIRISSSFTPDGIGRFAAECFQSVPEQVARAKAELEDATFRIADLSAERWQNIIVGRQTYPLCAFKEVGCVVGPDANVWACCSLAFDPRGLMFSMQQQTFEDGWYGDGWAWRKAHDPRTGCPVQCLYWARNLDAMQLMGDPGYAARVADGDPPPHRNFI
jgi:wyosine [tRNA(Phe)-imidazoG37] synthetase (radical SAM superfamily)